MRLTIRACTAVAVFGLLTLPLTGCAPEPGTQHPDGTDLTEKVEPEGGSWPEQNPDEAFEKSAELPPDFPGSFVVPADAVIDDAGSRGDGSWFVVFRAADADAGSALWDAVVQSSGFTVTDEIETVDGGRAATLSSPDLSVSAVTLTGDNGTVLLSYDLGQPVG